MKIISPLYQAIATFLQSGNWKDKRHKITLIWMVYGLIQVRKINIPEWIPFVQSRAKKAQSTERRFSRWLYNPSIDVADIYDPLIKYAIKDWEDETVYIALDTSMLWNTFCQIRLCIIYRGRAVPLVWKTIKHGSSSVSLDSYRDLLEQTKTLIPSDKRVVFLADRGFVDTKLMQFLTQTLHWHWRIRYKVCINAYRAGKRQNKPYCLLKMTAQYGHARFYHNVYVTDSYYGKVHLAFARHSKKQETWLIASDEPTSLETFTEYGLRFDIEEGFKDDKSGLFQLESSQFRDAQALTRLYLPIAVATLFLTSQGVDVVTRGIRQEIDPHWKRALSYLKIGLRYVVAALAKNLSLITHILLPSTADPEPVYSAKGALSNRERIEQFQYTEEVFL
jgi:hypothetical protein